jgi:LysM repeat protein
MGRMRRLVWLGSVLLVWGIGLLGCRQPRPPQVVEVLTVEATATGTAVAQAADPTVAAILAQITPTATSTLSPTTTPTAGPFVCPRPPGWVAYVVQANDTLYSLAARTGTAVDALKVANCLLDDILIIGDLIYLPTLPPPPPPPVFLPPPGVEAVLASACSPFSCPNPELASFSLKHGDPNDAEACQTGENGLDIRPEREGVWEKGELLYFYGCGLFDFNSLTATVTGPTGISEFLTPMLTDQIPDFRGEKGLAVAFWGARCDLENGRYTVSLSDNQGNRAEKSFELGDSSHERLLILPPFGPPGTSFALYGCRYETYTNSSVTIDISFATDRQEEPDGFNYTLAHIKPVTMIINQDDWGWLQLPSLGSDPIGAYWLQDRDDEETGEYPAGEVMMWLTEP